MSAWWYKNTTLSASACRETAGMSTRKWETPPLTSFTPGAGPRCPKCTKVITRIRYIYTHYLTDEWCTKDACCVNPQHRITRWVAEHLERKCRCGYRIFEQCADAKKETTP